ncbi:MAG TPA: LLM class flavin-dependent oxidoreductase [Actinomycetales bacterium]|nr:LLM class flavin-dependent oxidoreductase [Actinomycetales bacterium]
MRYGLDISPAGPWGDPRTMAGIAALAERSGWDGIFCEDYLVFPGAEPSYDPWITLTAVALATDRVVLGTLVTPLPRRHPAVVASQAMTLDHLSGGRVVLGVGSGDPDSAEPFVAGEATDAAGRAARLDRALDDVTGFCEAQPRRRVPIWVGGALTRRGPRARALRWEGACLYRVPPPAWEDIEPDDVRTLREDARELRGDDDFVVAVGGRERRDDVAAELDYVTALRDAGATWWHEYVPPWVPIEVARERIAGGPLRARQP